MNRIQKTHQILEFDQMKEQLLQYAATDYAKEKIQALKPFLYEAELRAALQETSSARRLLDVVGTPSIPSVTEIKAMLTIAEKNGLLYPEQLDRFISFIAAGRRLKSYLKKAEATGEGLAFYGQRLDTIESLYTELTRCIRGTELDTNASKALGTIRRQLDQTKQQIKGKLDELLKAKKAYCSDSFVSMKNGRYTLPVKKEYKHQIAGSVVAVSATGTTCFIEPSAVSRLTEQLDRLKTEESIEIDKLLYMLTNAVFQAAEPLRQNIETMEALDFAFAKGRLSASQEAVAPVLTTERYIEIKRGRHPLIPKEQCVPLDFAIGRGVSGVVITGPNTGGKTVALKLVGLFSLMAQCGLHLPCEGAVMCMMANVLCDIGDGQSISENLSTFSAHITNITAVLEETTSTSLVLLDELGSGTDPAEGMGIAIAIIEGLLQKQCLFVTTTHYAEVKRHAERTAGLQNARMTFDAESLQPLYRLILGEAGESCALRIAKRLGFPPALLAYAERVKQHYERSFSDTAPEADTHAYGALEQTYGAESRAAAPHIVQQKQTVKPSCDHAAQFQIGDSVFVYPERKIGIVYRPADETGMVVVQLQGKKRKVNHKRLKRHVVAEELYPPDYDFSIIFDSVENRKAAHQMERKYSPELSITHTDV